MAKSIVKQIGTLVPTFKDDKIIILFGPQAPQELIDISVIHEFTELSEEPLKVGGIIKFDHQEYEITHVGNVANDNLKELGHVSIYFQEPFDGVLPGAVLVKPSEVPEINEGTVIEFIS